MFHVLKTPVSRFDLYGRYQILWTDIAHNTSLCAKFQVYSSLRSDAIGQRDIAQIIYNFVLMISNVSKEPRVADQYFWVLHKY